MSIEKNYTENRFEKYHSLVDEIREMIASKGRGYQVAQKMNDQFWEELGTHRMRMLEQIDRMEKSESEEMLQQELTTANSIYEATRKYLEKKA